jgi:hypothetical protein
MRTLRQWWTLFYYGGTETICSKHASISAALAAAARCEKRGGADHRILMVDEEVPYGRRKRAKSRAD